MLAQPTARGSRNRRPRPVRRWLQGLLLGGVLTVLGAGSTEAVLVDAVLAQVGSGTVSASDIALARALGLFGFTPSQAPIGAADVDRYTAAYADVLEAARLGLGGDASELDQAWASLEARHGGPAAFQAWLDLAAIDKAWARRALEAHLRWRAWAEFHEGFSDMPGPPGESSGSEPLFGSDAVVHRLLRPSDTVPVPFPMPR